jgi:hypothetical protein
MSGSDESSPGRPWAPQRPLDPWKDMPLTPEPLRKEPPAPPPEPLKRDPDTGQRRPRR